MYIYYLQFYRCRCQTITLTVRMYSVCVLHNSKHADGFQCCTSVPLHWDRYDTYYKWNTKHYPMFKILSILYKKRKARILYSFGLSFFYNIIKYLTLLNLLLKCVNFAREIWICLKQCHPSKQNWYDKISILIIISFAAVFLFFITWKWCERNN